MNLLRLKDDLNLLQNHHIKIPDVPVFKITPMRLTLRPRESCVMTLEGTTDKLVSIDNLESFFQF